MPVATLARRLHAGPSFVQTVLEQLPSAILILVRGTTVRYINRRALEVLQLPGAVVGHDLAHMLPQAVELAAHGKHRLMNLVTPDRERILLGYSAVPVALEAEPDAATLVVFQQLDSPEQSEALLHHELTAALGRLTGGLAHELRNPLFAISAASQILIRETDNPLHRQLAEAMGAEAQRMKRLVDDLLTYGNPGALRMQLANPWNICDEVLAQFRPAAYAKGIRLRRLPAERERELRIDPERIREVFIHLVDNALRATQRGEVRVASFDRGREAVFEVADTGLGIEFEQLPFVFDPFFSRSPGGSGLGLPIVKKILEDHGGGVLVAQTQPRVGTTIQFWLPES